VNAGHFCEVELNIWHFFRHSAFFLLEFTENLINFIVTTWSKANTESSGSGQNDGFMEKTGNFLQTCTKKGVQVITRSSSMKHCWAEVIILNYLCPLLIILHIFFFISPSVKDQKNVWNREQQSLFTSESRIYWSLVIIQLFHFNRTFS